MLITSKKPNQPSAPGTSAPAPVSGRRNNFIMSRNPLLYVAGRGQLRQTEGSLGHRGSLRRAPLISILIFSAIRGKIGQFRDRVCWSSYSRVAILLNGSPRCKAIDHPLARLQYAVRRFQMLGRRLSQRRNHGRVGA